MYDDEDEFRRLLGERGLTPTSRVTKGTPKTDARLTAPAARPAAPSPPPEHAPVASNALAGEVARLRAELDAVRAAGVVRAQTFATERAAVTAALETARNTTASLELALASATSERDTVRAERDQVRAERDTVRAERDQVRAERRTADRRYGESQQALVELKSKVDRLARVRSLDRISAEVGEKALALRALLERFPSQTLAALAGDDENVLSAMLQRVVFTCEQPSCRLKSDVARVSVPRERCDICGGSVLAQHFVEFAAACRRASIDSVLVVGGSPAYRETLRDLGRDHRATLKLELTQELAPNDAERAKKVKGLVIIWGATEVDHTKTGIFAAAGDRRMTVAHRGLTGMLREVIGRLNGLPPTPSGTRS
ncbi:MAG: hypothetical protein IV100_15805 [Myxococcales bacterium]|nr:hypothetical protein [Myxococcales bacterium]